MLHGYPGTAHLAQLTVRRLAELNTTRARVEALESRAGAMVEAESVRRHADYVSALQVRVRLFSLHLSIMLNIAADPGADTSFNTLCSFNIFTWETLQQMDA